MTFRVLSLNIRHGGGRQTAQLIEWLLAKMPSVLVLPEWRNNGSGMEARLAEAGYETVATTTDIPKRNGVLLAARQKTPFEVITPTAASVGALILAGPVQSIRFLACYFPQRKAKGDFFQACVRQAKAHDDKPLILIGDLNTGQNDLDIEGNGTRFDCADMFDALTRKHHLIDLWRSQHGDKREWTWRSPVNGFRIDHCFGNRTFTERFPTFQCTIDHEPRLLGLTDHSAVVLDCE